MRMWQQKEDQEEKEIIVDNNRQPIQERNNANMCKTCVKHKKKKGKK